MGRIRTPGGTEIPLDEIEGILTLNELYEDALNTHYTETYRTDCIKACGKIGRSAWGVLMDLHELVKNSSQKISAAARDAIKQIDPGMPTFPPEGKKNTVERNFHNTTPAAKKPEVRKVEITEITGDLAKGARVWYTCSFCEKTALLTRSVTDFNRRLSPGRTFCNSCLRNGLYRSRKAKNTLMLSYRGVIGYYYHCFHLNPKSPSMTIAEIVGIVDTHVRFGLNNPLFTYDPDTYTWFVDLSRVGTGDRRVPIESVLETVVQQIAAFGLYEHVKDSLPVEYYRKFKESIIDFANTRRRPANRLLCPTLYCCGIPYETALTRAIPSETLKRFVPGHLVDAYKLKQARNNVYSY